MVTVSYPGVYVREIPSGVRSISGVSTSIAAFIGMAKRGPLLTPTRVLGFKDYERIFSEDTSQGEMTEQVQQFFINGGEQAYIIRVARNALQSTLTLNDVNGANVLELTSRDAGFDANQIRTRIDYNTDSPESTFNLELYRETFDASGQPQTSASETHRNLSMNPLSPSYAPTILDQQSSLVTATAIATAASGTPFSASAHIFANAAAAESDVNTAIADATASGGSGGRFRIKVGQAPFVTVELPTGGAVNLADIALAINTLLAPHTATTVAVSVAADAPLRIESSVAEDDVVIAPSPQLDIAAALGLGVAQGGIEVSGYTAIRPAPSGLVSVLDNAGPGDLGALLDFGAEPKANLTTLEVQGGAQVRPFATTTPPAYPDGAGNLNEGTQHGSPSLRNVVENLQAMAVSLNATSTDWRAEVHGHRLALFPVFGGASSGAGAAFASGATDIGGAGSGFIFDGVTAGSAAASLGAGDDGLTAEADEYDDAFQQIDEKVDLFNLMVLPKSAGDTANPSIRSSVWGAASSFCYGKRAFLIMDAEPVTETPQGILDSLQALRTGVLKDHAGVWWPKLTITSNGIRKQIDPSGSIAGLMSRIDGTRGVWKAPAGLEAAILGVQGVQFPMSDEQNGLLNPEAVNAIRSFPNGIISWGARTLDGFDNSGNTDYRYVPVRRFALFIEESLRRGLQFAVFEPNDEPLWAQIRLAAGAFMNGLFRRGAFAGATAADAYFVKADAETTTATDQNLGIVNVVVGFAALKPAEFIIISLQQKAGQVQV